MSYAIECQDLSKRYGRGTRANFAVQNLTLNIEAGQVYGFLGPNGAGKTTTIRMLIDLVKPTSGSIRILGESVGRNPAALKRVGALVEDANFYPYLSAWDNLKVVAWTMGAFNPHRAAELIKAVGLDGREHDAVGKFSTGMRQRLGIAAALLHDPDVVILDEPTNGLDPAAMREMRGFIRALATEHGKTVFVSSHLLGEVQQICDHVAIIQNGTLITEGRVQDLLAQGESSALMLDVQPIESALTALADWSPRREHDAVLIHAAHSDTPQVVRLLVAANVAVYGVRHRQMSLEDFFLSVTQTTPTTTEDT